MALGNVIMTDIDGNLGRKTVAPTEDIAGLIFDISGQPEIWTKGAGLELSESLQDKVIELNSLEDAENLGIVAFSGETDEEGDSKDFLAGIPYYHIRHFFNINGGYGRLFIMFADCSRNWESLIELQKASNGIIDHIGVWTEMPLWRDTDPNAVTYQVNHVSDLNVIGKKLADDYNAPVSIVLTANTAKVTTSTSDATKVLWSKLPTCISDSRYVSVLLGQDVDSEVSSMQQSLESLTPVGCIGAALGCLSVAKVAESIGWVQNFDLALYFSDIEFGFGDSSIEDGALKNTTKYDSLTSMQLNALDDLGYIFLMKYNGLEGHIYFSGDKTCSDGDYRTIARNRTINKSRREVRRVLLPYVNSPIKVDPATGFLSSAQSTIFANLVSDVLTAMQNLSEISGFTVSVPSGQNVIATDTVYIKYSLVPIGTAKTIHVTEGLALKNK